MIEEIPKIGGKNRSAPLGPQSSGISNFPLSNKRESFNYFINVTLKVMMLSVNLVCLENGRPVCDLVLSRKTAALSSSLLDDNGCGHLRQTPFRATLLYERIGFYPFKGYYLQWPKVGLCHASGFLGELNTNTNCAPV